MLSMTSTNEDLLHDLNKQVCKFSSKQLSKETTPSFRVLYYGVASAGSVPFMWESQPGTPKHAACTTTLPPLTPPPSYYTSHKNTHKATTSKNFKPSFISAILPKIALRRNPSSSFAPFSSPSSVFYGVPSSTGSVWDHRRVFSVGGGEEEEERMVYCFRMQDRCNRWLKGCRVAAVLKSAFACVGRRQGSSLRYTSSQ